MEKKETQEQVVDKTKEVKRQEIIQHISEQETPFNILIDETFPANGFAKTRKIEVKLPIAKKTDLDEYCLKITMDYGAHSIGADAFLKTTDSSVKVDVCRFYLLKSDGTVVFASTFFPGEYSWPWISIGYHANRNTVFSGCCSFSTGCIKFDTAANRSNEFADGFVRIQYVLQGTVTTSTVTDIITA